MGEKGSGEQLKEGEWRLGGGEGSREFTMREWEDKGTWGKITRDREGGEWDLRRGRGWGEGGVGSLESGDTSITVVSMNEEEEKTICCSGDLAGIKILITLSGVINLGIIAAGGVGFTLGLVEGWSDKDLFTSTMVIIDSIYDLIKLGTSLNYNSHFTLDG